MSVTYHPSPKLMPGVATPELTISTVGGETWRLQDQQPQNFTMIVVYRGLHCPICQAYLADLEGLLDKFGAMGIGAIAISGDSEEKARQAKTDWGLEKLTVGYGQSVDSMRDWGLYVSDQAFDYEPQQFGEPGLFLVRPDGTLYYAAINNAPFGRPNLKELQGSLGFILEKNYPTRGMG